MLGRKGNLEAHRLVPVYLPARGNNPYGGGKEGAVVGAVMIKGLSLWGRVKVLFPGLTTGWSPGK